MPPVDSWEMPFQRLQSAFAANIRNPQTNPIPEEVDARRMKIYQELFYKNIEGFISGGFPVARQLYSDEQWASLVREFIEHHRCETPYFLQISEEFLVFLQQRTATQIDPPFLLELCHYEWVELALDVSEDEFPDDVDPSGDLLENIPVVSPLVWSLCYHYPVHLIGAGFQPEQPGEQPTYLIVYRNRDDEVKFMEANAVTARLIELMQNNSVTGRELLHRIADELNHPNPVAILDFGTNLLNEFQDLDIIAGTRRQR